MIALHGFANALLREIRDPDVAAIAAGPLIGSVDLFSDNTDLLESVGLRRALRGLYKVRRASDNACAADSARVVE